MNSGLGLEIVCYIHCIVCNCDAHEVIDSHSQHVEEGNKEQIVNNNCNSGAQYLQKIVFNF